ncbi:MAG TPA: FHA domain-containing protein, partial [Chthoniobacteraceae bacterium]|nr:FHA domain-containing protein [Chthoniobacteraceae bacterium]
MPALRIKLPNSEATTHVLRGARVTVGRAPDNTIQIPHASISSHHAEFVAVNGRYQLHDLHSTNRSYVEGQPVTACDLSDSCKILFGAIECEFDSAAPPPTAKRLELPPAPAAEPRAEPLFLEAENRALRDGLHALQRRFDILGSARLVTAKTDPLAEADDAMKE